MKRFKLSVCLMVLSIIAASLAGCGVADSTGNSAAPMDTAPSTGAPSGPLQTNYENALPIPNQLALGIFKLDETGTSISSEQATALLPLWKAYRSLSANEDGSSQEINALIVQVQEALSEDQLQAIAAMKLTMQDLAQLAQEKNLALGAGGPGGGAGLSEEERATRQAQRFSGQGSGSGGGAGPGSFGPPPGGGFGPGGGVMPGGELPPGAMETPGVRQTAVAQRRGPGDGGVSPALVEALIAFLEEKVK